MSDFPTPEDFAATLLEPFDEGARVWVLSDRRGNPRDWTGQTARPSQLADLDPRSNHWISTAAYPKGAPSREMEHMLGVAAIVIDDPTTKGDAAKLFETLGKPTARIRTSRKSWHWWYFLKEPATVAQVRPILSRIKALGLGDSSGNNANRYARLPFGVNSKREHGGEVFRVRGVEWTERRFSVDRIAEALDVTAEQKSAAESGCPMNSELTDDELREQVLTNKNYHDAVMVLAARMIARGAEPGDVTEELRKLMDSCHKKTRRDESWQTTYDQIETRLVDTAVKKFAPKNRRVIDDFVSYLPYHSYLFLRTMQLWPGGSVDACVRWPGKGSSKTKPSTYLDRNRAAHAMTWHPSEPQLIEGKVAVEGGWEDDPASVTVNTYKAPVVKDGDAALAGRWLRHLRKIYPEHWKHIADWLAFKVQKPGIKINHGIVLAGPPGIGKDSLTEPVRYAVGVTNYKVVGPRVLLSEFNDHVKSVILHVSEARDLGPNDRFGLYESNKDLLAAPPVTLRVNEKNLRPHWVFNVVGVIFTTNHAVDGLYIAPNDRRHYVASSPITKEQFTETYWLDFWKWYRNGGTWHVVAWLKERDIDGFDPGAPPERTDAWRTMVQGGASSEDQAMQGVIEKLNHPKALTIEMLKRRAGEDLRSFLEDRDNRRQLKHRLAGVSYAPFGNPDTKSGLWKIRGEYVQVYVRSDITRNDAFTAIKDLKASNSTRHEVDVSDDDDLV